MRSKVYKFILHSSKVIAKIALVLVVYNVNTCCALFAYQDKIPEEADRFKKI